MTRRTYTMLAGIVLLIVLAVGASQLPVQYAAMGPGVTRNVLGRDVDGKQVVQVTGRATRKTTGNLNMTTVSELDHLDLLRAVYGWFSSDEAVVPRTVLFPPGQSDQQINAANQQDFVQSQDSAEAAALGYLHYPQRVVVAGLPDDSPADGTLKTGDVIETVRGKSVSDVAGLQKLLSTVPPGTKVAVRLQRQHRPQTLTVTTGKADKGGGSVLGIQAGVERYAPFDTAFNLRDIGGPSAGLMFALGLLDKIGPDDLTDGKFIAGTGTIDADGKVGPIGGIPLKMIGAKRAGATIFLVPAQNCAEAKDHHPNGLRLIKVDTLAGAVQALKAVQHGGSTPAC